MGFDTRESLVSELKIAKEIGDQEYVQQVREALVAWDLDDRFTLIWPNEINGYRKANSIECDGIYLRFGTWARDNNLVDSIEEAIDDLSGGRTNRKGGSRWDLLDNYKLNDNGVSVGGVIIAGGCCYAEIWFDDAIIAYIELKGV